ncbi:MAG: ABC transporter permease, partial [Halovenus sp.]
MATSTPADNRRLLAPLQDDPKLAAWVAVGLFLFALQVGAVAHFLTGLVADLLGIFPTAEASNSVLGRLVGLFEVAQRRAAELPTLLSRDVVPNAGHWNGDRWVGTFMGFSPAVSWGIRVTLVYAYAFTWVVWAVLGYRYYREQYRVADWTPRDDIVDRFRSHGWGLFGATIVFLFVVMVVFAPTLGPTTVEQNMESSYDYETTYWNSETEEVETILTGEANLNSKSTGDQSRVMPMSYDDFGRFHPFGTLPNGRDLFTFIVA